MLVWRPIETAPRTKRPVYVWMPYTQPASDIGWWVDCKPGCDVCAAWGDTGYFDFFGSDGGHDMQPTYWAPISMPETGPPIGTSAMSLGGDMSDAEVDAEDAPRRERFKAALAKAVADPENVPPLGIVYPVRAIFVVDGGPKAQLYDARSLPCLPGFIEDEEVAATLANWINRLAHLALAA